MRFFRVQAQVSSTTVDGWDSSRQVRTMIVGAADALGAARDVSHLAWDMSSGVYLRRRTVATVIEVIPGDDGGFIPTGPFSFVLVRYLGTDGVVAQRFDTYAELAASEDN